MEFCRYCSLINKCIFTSFLLQFPHINSHHTCHTHLLKKKKFMLSNKFKFVLPALAMWFIYLMSFAHIEHAAKAAEAAKALKHTIWRVGHLIFIFYIYWGLMLSSLQHGVAINCTQVEEVALFLHWICHF